VLRAILVSLPFLCGGCIAPPAEDLAASRYPNRPIKLVVPFNAGGGTDAYARVIDKAIKDHDLLPEPFVVINVGGAGATIGSRRVKNARPDGYTVLILHDAIITAKLSRRVGYGPEAFEPIAGTSENGMVIAVREDSPYETLPDLLEAARRKPETINFGANLGALTHYAGLLLEDEYPGAKFIYSQAGGGASRFSDLAGNHIQVTGFSVEEFSRFRSSKDGSSNLKGLRGLAIFSEQRDDDLPNVPTAKEQGIDIVLSNTFYWWAPKGTPQERIDVLAEALRKAIEKPEVRRRLQNMHIRPVFLRGEKLQARIDRSTKLYGRVSAAPPAKLPNYPAVVSTVILGLCLLRGWEIWRERRSAPTPTTPDEVAPRHRAAILVVLLSFGYFAVLAFSPVPFSWATGVFVLAAGGLLIRRRTLVNIAGLCVLASLLGFGLNWLLVRVFDVYFS